MTEKKWNPRDWSQQPMSIYPDYKSTSLRNPKSPLIKIDLPENMKGPSFMKSELRDLDADLTKNAKNSHEPIGERIVVIGQVKDEYDRPVRNCLIEIWQANCGTVEGISRSWWDQDKDHSHNRRRVCLQVLFKQGSQSSD